MSNKTDQKSATNAVAVKGQFDDVFEAMDKRTGELVDLATEYIELSPGQVFDAIAEGVTTTTFKKDEGEKEVAVLFIRGENKRVITAAKVLINSIKKMNLPAPVRVTVKDTVKGQNGSYLDMTVQTLPEYYKK